MKNKIRKCKSKKWTTHYPFHKRKRKSLKLNHHHAKNVVGKWVASGIRGVSGPLPLGLLSMSGFQLTGVI